MPIRSPHSCPDTKKHMFNVKKLREMYIEKAMSNYLTIMLRAPSGVTRTAGANAYATKFAISPTTTCTKNHTTGFLQPTMIEIRERED